MRILSVVPVLYDIVYTDLCLKQITGDLLVIDNNAEPLIKARIEPYNKIINAENIYVNPAWNQAMKFFLDGDYDLLCLISSDVILMNDWESFVRQFYIPDSFMFPKLIHTGIFPANYFEGSYKILGKNNPGFFLTLTRSMAERSYPIPEDLKIWFGDNWIYNRNPGSPHLEYSNFMAIHGNSRSVVRVENVTQIIEQDKINWQKYQ